jgi:hypothetical protein
MMNSPSPTFNAHPCVQQQPLLIQDQFIDDDTDERSQTGLVAKNQEQRRLKEAQLVAGHDDPFNLKSLDVFERDVNTAEHNNENEHPPSFITPGRIPEASTTRK